MAVPQAPVDQSGGYMVIQYTNGTDTHRMRVHVLPFSTSSFVVGGVAGVSDDGHHNYAYVGSRPAGSELGINDTFQAFVNVIKPYFAASWTFTLLALYQTVGGVPTEIFPTPTPTGIVGTNAGAAPSGISRTFQFNWNFKSLLGGKARICFMGTQVGGAPGVPVTVTASTGGVAQDQAVVAYLSGANTAVVAHDGQKFQGTAHITTLYNRRLRRHYGYA